MTPVLVLADISADPTTSPKVGMSTNNSMNMTRLSTPGASEPISTSHYVASQTLPAELLYPIPIQILVFFLQNILITSAVEKLSDTKFNSKETCTFLQQLVATTGSEDTEDLGTLKQEKNAVKANKAQCEDRVRFLKMQLEIAL